MLGRFTKKTIDLCSMFKNNENQSARIHIVQPTITVNLLIKRLDFFSGLFWEFVYIKPIIATIQDELFLNQVRSGQIEFRVGYELSCSLQIEYDIEKGEVKKEKYTIIKVFKVIESIPSKGDIIKVREYSRNCVNVKLNEQF